MASLFKSGFVCLLLVFALCVTIVGCSKKEELGSLDSGQSTSLGDQLPMTLNYVFTDEQFTYGEFRERVEIGLNRWIKSKIREDGETEWNREPLLDTLNEKIKADASFGELEFNRFLGADAHYLQHRLWTKRIAERESIPSKNRFYRFWSEGISRADAESIQTNRTPDRLAVGLSRLHEGISDEHASDLATSIRMFDWTVRNVKLVELLDWPTEEVIEEQRLLREEGDWAPDLGVRGPGYVRHTWQVFLYGQGDALERARVFMELLLEFKIDAAMIEIKSGAEQDGTPVTRWMVGVSIGDSIYLFEPGLGLPVMQPGTSKIATLDQLKSNVEILRGLNLTVAESLENTSKYWPNDQEIESINVKLYGTPESLSKRMQLLEKNLTGTWRLNLVNSPSVTKDTWLKHDSDQQLELWEVPFLVKPFRRAVDTALVYNDPQIMAKLEWYRLDEFYINEFPPFRRARNLYLKGKLSADDLENEEGATSIYFNFIYQDDTIRTLPSNTPLLESLGVRRANQSQMDFQNRVRSVQSQMYLIRADACFYTAMCHLAAQNPSTALNWFNRVEDYEPDDGRYIIRWDEAVVFMRGRIRESIGQYDQAIEALRKDETSPQRNGNILRARYIEQLLSKQPEN